MSSKMLQFVATKKAMPEKRTADNRVADFDEIYHDFVAAAADKAGRLLYSQYRFCGECAPGFIQTLGAEANLAGKHECFRSRACVCQALFNQQFINTFFSHVSQVFLLR